MVVPPIIILKVLVIIEDLWLSAIKEPYLKVQVVVLESAHRHAAETISEAPISEAPRSVAGRQAKGNYSSHVAERQFVQEKIKIKLLVGIFTD